MDPILGLHGSQWGWIALWLALGVLIGLWMGFSRGRPLQGALLGAPLGPLAFFALRGLQSNLLECLACSRSIQRTARRCKHCGADIDQARKQTARQRSKQQSMR